MGRAMRQPQDAQYGQQKSAPIEFFKLLGLLISAVLGVLVVSVLVPWLIIRGSGRYMTPRARFWVVSRWRWMINTAGVIGYVALVLVELSQLGPLVRSGELQHTLQAPNGWQTVIAAAIPWAIANFLAGILFVPLLLSIYRRRTARTIRDRRHMDVMMQVRIETARMRAADIVTAHKIGVKLDPRSGQIIGSRPGALTAPHPLKSGSLQFGVVNSATIRTFVERMYDIRRIRDWIDPTGQTMVLPSQASAVRAILIAESGSGKTVLLVDLMLCALAYKWPIVFIDAKGDPDDARKLKELVEGLDLSVSVNEPWNLFTGTAAQITEKLMRLWPQAQGDGQFYVLEARGVLQAVQYHSPLRSLDDLGVRVKNPGTHVAGPEDSKIVNAKTREGTTAGQRVYNSLRTYLSPLDQWLSPNGWSYSSRRADVTVMSIVPVEEAQARLADLLLMDLRNYMATRLTEGDKSPLLAVVDEFPQLVTVSGVDAGDTAGSLFETARSAGMGLILAAQSTAGLSNDETRRRRALASGAALIVGRSKDPEDVVSFAGTQMQMEASGAAAGDELRSARAQHTWIIDPNDVRTAADGAFWIIQAGGAAPFRALPNPRIADSAAAEPVAVVTPAADQEPAEEPTNLWVRGSN
jgi:hypothetical protein